MYKVTYGNKTILDPEETGYVVTDCSADLKLNETSSMSFTLPLEHELNSNIDLFDTQTEIVMTRDGIELFRGRAVSETYDMDGNCTYTCEGVRAYLNDILLPPYTTAPNDQTPSGTETAPSEVSALFEWYINKYNERCTPSHRLKIGINEGSHLDANNYILRSNSTRATVWSEIKDKLLDKLGGYIFMRVDGTQHVIDYRASAIETVSQKIEFGVNLLDFERERTGTSLGTVCIPTGKDEDNNEINIKSLADGEYKGYKKSGECVYLQSDVDELGWIEFNETTDATTAEGCLNAGISALKSKDIADTITVSALDLTILSDYDDGGIPYTHMLKEGYKILIDTGAHDLVGTATCTARHLDLLDPSQDTYDIENDAANFARRVDSSTIIDERFANYVDRTAQNALSEATDAKAEAQNVQERADSGEFDGRGIVDTAQKYALSEDTETQPENWLSEPPTMTTYEPYLWTYDETTYTDDTTSTTDPRIIGAYGETGPAGTAGTGVSSIVRQYAISTSQTTAPTSGWSTTPPAYVSGSYYWERDYITWTTGKITATDGVLSKGLNSANSTALDAKTNASTANANASTALTKATNANNKMHYATCSTAGATAAKVATLNPSTDTLTLTNGVSVSVKFTYANTANAPTLNVGGTYAKPIYTNGGQQSAYWQAWQSVLFTYDGSYWRVASEPVYASKVTVGNSAENHVYIDSDGVNIRDGETTLASFTASKATIGQTGSINAQIDNDSFDIYDGSTSYMSMGYIQATGYSANKVIGVQSLGKKPLVLSTACDINGDYSWSEQTRSGAISSWVQRECSYSRWHITAYIPQANQTYFYAELVYTGSSSGTVISVSYPPLFKLKTNTPYHASVSTRQSGTASSYAGFIQANATDLSFYPCNTVGTSASTDFPFTVFLAGFFTYS